MIPAAQLVAVVASGDTYSFTGRQLDRQ